VSNLVDVTVAALRNPEASGTFNVGDPDTPTVAEVVEHLLFCLDLPATITWIPRSVAWRAAIIAERLAGAREPLLSRYAVNQMSLDFTLCLDRVRRDLDWEPSESYRTAFTRLRKEP
jgi:nucleoside-diphosphate-sugar epimerase